MANARKPTKPIRALSRRDDEGDDDQYTPDDRTGFYPQHNVKLLTAIIPKCPLQLPLRALIRVIRSGLIIGFTVTRMRESKTRLMAPHCSS